MTRVVRYIALFLLIAFAALPEPSKAQQPQAVVNGRLIAAYNGQPAPGMTVSLVHPMLGRSVPVMSDNFGNFSMYGIPLSNDPYYVEVYWGTNLVYRQVIMVTAPLINLPPFRM